MDRFHVEVQPEYDLLEHLPFFVYINNKHLTEGEEWYCLGLDSYIRALDFKESTVEFIGSCGVYSCCGFDLRTRMSPECWSWFAIEDHTWKEYRLDWNDVYSATKYMIERNQGLPEGSDPGDACYDNFPEHRQKLEFIKSMMNGKELPASDDPNLKCSVDEWREKHIPTHKKLSRAAEIAESIKAADLALFFHNTSEVEIGISRVEQGKQRPMLFSQPQLYQFLIDYTNEKDLLVVCLKEGTPDEICIDPPPDCLGFPRSIICRGMAEEIYEMRKAAARETLEVRRELKARRYVLCNEAQDKFDIGIGRPAPWNPTKGVYDSADGKIVWLNSEELLSFLHQDTRRGTVLFCLEDTAEPSEELKRIAEQSGFPAVSFGNCAVPLNKC